MPASKRSLHTLFAKSDRANIDADEEKQFKGGPRVIRLRLTERQIAELVRNGDLVPISIHSLGQDLSEREQAIRQLPEWYIYTYG
jgi:hypothetical protein